MKASLSRLLRRPLFWGPLAGVVLLLGWWFAWMVPQASKLTTAHQQQSADQAAIVGLETRLSQLHGVAKKEVQAKQFLGTFAKAVPASPDAPQLVVEIYRLATAHGLHLQSITDNAVDPAAGYSTIPLSLTVSGGRPGITRFVNGLYRLPRLVTVQQLQLTGPSTGDVLTGGGSHYQATISATAYTTSLSASSTAGAASTASTTSAGGTG